jgi:hypothetical protein
MQRFRCIWHISQRIFKNILIYLPLFTYSQTGLYSHIPFVHIISIILSAKVTCAIHTTCLINYKYVLHYYCYDHAHSPITYILPCDHVTSWRASPPRILKGSLYFLSKKLLMPLLPQYYMSSVSPCVRGLSPHNLKLLKLYPFSKAAIRQFLITIDLFHY